MKTIAPDYGVSVATVRNILHRRGVKPRSVHDYQQERRPTFTEQEKTEIVAAYREGTTVRALSGTYGCRTEVISAILAEDGLAPQQGGHRRFTDAEEAQIAQSYQGGASTTALAALHGCSKVLITRIARDHGLIVRGRGNSHKIYTDEQVAEIVRLRVEEEWTQQQIADEMGVRQATISQVLSQQGLPTQAHRRGVMLTGDGYVREGVDHTDPYFSMANRAGYILQHRLVVARALDRPLTDTETVHHIDGNPRNNDLGNLQLRQGRHGNGVVATCLDCGSHNIGTAPIKEEL